MHHQISTFQSVRNLCVWESAHEPISLTRGQIPVISECPLLLHECSLACIWTGHSRVVGTVECLSFEVFAIQDLFTGSAHREPISLTPGRIPVISERPLLFHERSLACIWTGHSQVVGTVKYLCFKVFAICAFRGAHTSRFLWHGDEFPSYPQTPTSFS